MANSVRKGWFGRRFLLAVAAVIAVAVSQVAMAAVSFTISADKKKADFAFDASHRAQVLYFAYGNADGGDSTNGWEHVEKVADIAAQATEAKDVSLPEGCGTEWGICRAFLLNAGTAKDYARQDKLIVQYDGIENAGYGTHATTLTSWKDLKGGHDLPILAGDTVSTTYIKMTTNAHTTADAIIASHQTLFFEVSSSSGCVDNWPAKLISVPRVGWMGAHNKNEYFYTSIPWKEGTTWKNIIQTANTGKNLNGFVGTLHTKSAWMNSQGGKSIGGAVPTRYFDGAKVPWSWDNGHGSATTLPTDLTLTLSGTYRGLLTSFRAVRVYTVNLAESDVVLNAKIDSARFNNGPLVVFHASEIQSVPRPFAVTKLTKAADDRTPVSADLTFTGKAKIRKLYIAYGRQDGGDDPAAWVGSEYVCDIPANSSAATVTIPDAAAAYLAKKGGYRFLLGKDATATDYVRQDKLILQYDGIENAGYGTHAETLANWKDLKGGHDMPLQDGDVVSADYVQMTTSAHTTADDIIASYQTLFFELHSQNPSWEGDSGVLPLMRIPRVGTLGYYLTQGGLATSIPWNEAGTWKDVRQISWISWSFADFAKSWGTYSAWMNAQGGKSLGAAEPARYYNGEKKDWHWDNGHGSAAACPSELTLTLNGKLGSSGCLTTRFRSVRIYNVKLTDAEVAYNRKVDKSRFEGGDPVVFEVTDFARANSFGLIIVVE